jgi:hypothetical protein
MLREDQWYRNDENTEWDEQLAHIYDQIRPTDTEGMDFEEIARHVAKKLTGVQSIIISPSLGTIPYHENRTHNHLVFSTPLVDSYNIQTIV